MPFELTWQIQLHCILRLGLAALCGLTIGHERSSRLKVAGTRTHIIVAIGAALMMIVSKYGFSDMAPYGDFYKVDVSRIASQIVTGIGFLGAGTIFVKNRSITGLTTAAGIWTTAGIGMAIGAGMYLIGLFCTGLVLLTQFFIHGHLDKPNVVYLDIRFREGKLQDVMSVIKEMGMQVINMDISRKKEDIVKVTVELKLPDNLTVLQAVQKLDAVPYIIEVGEPE